MFYTCRDVNIRDVSFLPWLSGPLDLNKSSYFLNVRFLKFSFSIFIPLLPGIEPGPPTELNPPFHFSFIILSLVVLLVSCSDWSHTCDTPASAVQVIKITDMHFHTHWIEYYFMLKLSRNVHWMITWFLEVRKKKRVFVCAAFSQLWW